MSFTTHSLPCKQILQEGESYKGPTWTQLFHARQNESYHENENSQPPITGAAYKTFIHDQASVRKNSLLPGWSSSERLISLTATAEVYCLRMFRPALITSSTRSNCAAITGLQEKNPMKRDNDVRKCSKKLIITDQNISTATRMHFSSVQEMFISAHQRKPIHKG